ncbi:pyrroline-5-carboxylate reductase family protein [Labrys wisconsinensis]|uniref:Pyrroline-5-carboxylate reductase n=1 Tax=Labrys wisconsinensis TaxID=425677 RepID=A0ABU0J0Y2_9HYPH|nr:pyrroline-5-carboxylate reductase dimerization domain-containing protein [Labrys wisconsinensis]MDQ0467920.1 pyrroline-5-carboxylate reductase [Labrys wisconsinensis]
MAIIGVIGVGHLAAAMLQGLMRAGFPAADLVLSPRGRAAEIGASHGIALAADNAALVERAGLVLLAVRPAAAAGALAGLPWRRGQLVVSACAGVPLAALKVVAAPAEVMRIMPLTAAEIGASPTAVFPDLPAARPLLDPLGPVVPLASERDFEVATVSAAIYGWVQDLVGRSAAWSERHGLAPDTARRLTALTFVAAARLIGERDEPIPDLLRSLVTPGGITERGLDVLAARDVPQAWDAACDAVLAKLTGQG